MKCGKIEKKIKTSITIDEDLLSWIDKLIDSKRFANITTQSNASFKG